MGIVPTGTFSFSNYSETESYWLKRKWHRNHSL